MTNAELPRVPRAPRVDVPPATPATPAQWDGFTAADLARHCAVPRVELFAETQSTLDVAHALAERGAVSGTLVLADAQSAGRGRHGRSWSSEPGRGVWCTIIERPADRAVLDVLSLRVGLLAAEALDGVASERVGVKWPNDLVLRTGKLGGILTEARWSGSSPGWVAIGVGVNVLAPSSVSGAAGLPAGVRRIAVLTAVAAAVRAAAAVAGHLSRDELNRYHDRDILSGRVLASPGRGTARDITAAGALRVETAAGDQEYRAGTVQFAEEEERS